MNIVSLTQCIICVLYEFLFVNNESRNIGFTFSFIHSESFIHSLHSGLQRELLTIPAAGRLSTKNDDKNF